MGKTISKAEQKKKLRSVYLKKRSEMELIKKKMECQNLHMKTISDCSFN